MEVTFYPLISSIFASFLHQISRNRLGLNDRAHEIAKEEAAKEKAQMEREAAKRRIANS